MGMHDLNNQPTAANEEAINWAEFSDEELDCGNKATEMLVPNLERALALIQIPEVLPTNREEVLEALNKMQGPFLMAMHEGFTRHRLDPDGRHVFTSLDVPEGTEPSEENVPLTVNNRAVAFASTALSYITEPITALSFIFAIGQYHPEYYLEMLNHMRGEAQGCIRSLRELQTRAQVEIARRRAH